MAKARSKKKAKSGSKAKKTTAAKKKVVAKAGKKAAKKVALKAKASAKKAKKPAPKKPAPKKAAARKPAPKKVAVKATAPRPPAPKATPAPAPAAPKQPLPPEVDRALAQADVEGLINRLPPPVQPVVKTLRKLVLEAAPEASELLDDGAPAYFANGVFARIVPSERSVLVKFLRGGELPSASELSAGEGEGDTRTLSLTSVEELKESVLRKVVREAVMLNLSTPVTVQA